MRSLRDSIVVFVAVMILCVLPAVVHAAPVGLLYGIRHSPTAGTDRLVTINPDTLELTVVGDLGVYAARGGLAYDVKMDILYGVSTGFGGDRSLFKVDRTTGAATFIGTHGWDLTGLAFDSTNDVLYASGTDQNTAKNGLYRLNTSTGAAALVGEHNQGLTGLAYDSLNDRLVGSNSSLGLFEVNRTNAALTSLAVGSLTATNGGLAYDSDKNLFWGVRANNTTDPHFSLISRNPQSGYAQTVHLNDLTQINALEYISFAAVPTPAAVFMALPLLTAVGVTRPRRRVAA